jgi:outer membrane protein TolC
MILVILVMMSGTAEIQPAAFFAGNEELRTYLLEGAQDHPGLKARYAEWQAALEKVPQARSLDDPMLMYTRFLESMEDRFMVELEQKFPWFGVLRARGDKAVAEAEAVLAMFYAERNEIFAQIKQVYFEYAYLAEGIRLVESQAQILKYVEDIVRSMYSLGLADQAELLRVQIEQAELQDRYNGLLQYRPALSARLSETLGREVGEELPWPQSAALPPPPPPAPVVRARIRVANPDLAAFDHQIQSREKEVELARKMRYPEITLGFGYGFMKRPPRMPRRTAVLESLAAANRLASGTAMNVLDTLMDLDTLSRLDQELDGMEFRDDVTISVGMNLPIRFRRIRAGIEEAKHMESAAEHERHRKALSLDSAAHAALFGVQDGLRRYNLYKDTLVPQARQTYESVQSAYSSGGLGADFLDLMESVRKVLEFQLEQAGAERDVQQAAAELEMLMGGPWASESENP